MAGGKCKWGSEEEGEAAMKILIKKLTENDDYSKIFTNF